MFERDDKTARFYIDAHGPDDDAVRDGVRWLVGFAEESGSPSAAIAVASLRQIEHLGRVLGNDVAKRLHKDREVMLGSLQLEAFTDRTTPHSYAGPVLAVWVNDDRLVQLDSLDAPGLCAIPWSRDAIEGWKANWNPTDVRTGASAGHDTTVTNPVVAAALASLTAAVNLSSGLVHPSDKTAAVEMFHVLKRGHETWDPAEIEAWAVRNGWEPRHARDLADMATKIAGGRAVQRGRNTPKMWRDDELARWRAEAGSR